MLTAMANTVSSGGQPAVAQRLQGEAQDDHGRPGACACGNGDLVEPHRRWSKRGARLSSWLTMIRVAPACAPSREQQIEERGLAVAVERRGRLVGHDQLRRADQRAGGGDALLLADAQVGGGAAARQVRLEAERVSRRTASSSARALGRRALAALWREAQRQQHVVDAPCRRAAG